MLLKISKNKLDFIIIFGFIFLPIILHLNETNLKQYQIISIFYLIIFQLLISILVILLSFLINILIFKKKKLYEILICNFSIIYFLFYYKKINSLKIIENLQSINHFLDNFISILIFLFSYVIIYYFLKKFNYSTKIFFLFFLSFNIIIGFYNMNIFNNFNVNKYNTNVSQNSINLDQLTNLKNKELTNVYLIILDGMINLEKAEKLKIIDSKKSFYEKLKSNDYFYNRSFKSNYPFTYASIQSLLYGDFPVTENSARYKSSLSFYPYNMTDKENFFYQIINKLDMNFFWIGNKNVALCKGLKSGECFYNYNSKKNFLSELIFSTELFYMNSLFSYFFNYLNKDLVVTAFDFLRYEEFQKKSVLIENKANFFLMHVYKPHKPYNLDNDCNDIPPRNIDSNEKKYYKINYKCAFDTLLKWDKNFLNKNQNNIVIILGDHGWTFDKKNKENINLIRSRIDDVFFAYKIPKKCNSIKVPNSHVNVMRFILNCLKNLKLEYLTDTQYIIRQVGHKDYGRTIKLKSK